MQKLVHRVNHNVPTNKFILNYFSQIWMNVPPTPVHPTHSVLTQPEASIAIVTMVLLKIVKGTVQVSQFILLQLPKKYQKKGFVKFYNRIF